MALAFLAFGLWLRLGRTGKLKLRAILFVPISIVVFFAHTFGWGALGLMCFSAEAVRQHDKGRGWFLSGDQGRAARQRDGAAAAVHDPVAERHAGRNDPQLVHVAAEVGMDLFGAARPLAGVRPGVDGGNCIAPAVRNSQPAAYAVSQPALFRARPDPILHHPAVDRFRIGLCRHAARALHDRGAGARDPRARRDAFADGAGPRMAGIGVRARPYDWDDFGDGDRRARS